MISKCTSQIAIVNRVTHSIEEIQLLVVKTGLRSAADLPFTCRLGTTLTRREVLNFGRDNSATEFGRKVTCRHHLQDVEEKHISTTAAKPHHKFMIY